MMKIHSLIIKAIPCLTVSALLSIFSQSFAATYYWDGATPAGAPGGGAGTWDTSSTNWDTSLSGGDIAWSNTFFDTAVFGGTAGTVNLGNNISVGGLQFNTTGYTISTGANTLSFSDTNNSILFNNIATATITGAVGGTGNLSLTASTPATAGTLTLNGTSAGGWTGTTMIHSGVTLSLSGLNQGLLNTSGITLNGGGISLTNTTSGEAALNRVNDSAGITSNGGTITYTNTSGTNVYAETLAAVDLVRGQTHFVLTNDQAHTGSQTLTLSDLTRTGALNNSAISFSSAGGLNTTKNRIVVTGATQTTSNQIIGPWATVGTAANAQTDYAVFNASSQVVAANIAAASENTWTNSANAYTANIGTSGGFSGALTSTRTMNALRSLTATNAVTVDSIGNTFSLTSNTFADGDAFILGGTAPSGLTQGNTYYVVGKSGNTFQLASTPGGSAIDFTTNGTSVTATGAVTLSSGKNLETFGLLNASTSTMYIVANGTGGVLTTPTGGGSLHVNTGSGHITINAPIQDNNGSVTLVKNGSGTLFLGNTSNSFTGNIIINSGTLSRLNFGDSAAIYGSGSNITFAGSGTLEAPNTAAGSTLNKSLTVNEGVFANLTFGSAAFSANFTGVFSGSGTLSFINSNGQATFSNSANTFTGMLRLNHGGSVTVNSLPDSAKPIQIFASSFILGGGAGNSASLLFNSRQIELLASGTIANNNTNASTTFTINTDLLVSNAGNKTLTLGGSNGGNNAFNGKIANGSGSIISLTKADYGTWSLTNANSYTGVTTLSLGTLQVNTLANGGSNSSIGASSNAASNLLLGHTTSLRYTGSGDSTDRSFTLNGSSAGHGATLDASGTGAVNFTNTASPAYGTTNQTRTLTLTGTNTDNNTLAANLADNGTGAVSLTKTGVGTWVLAGTSSHSGINTITAGVLNVSTLANGGSNSSLGKSSNAAANLVFGAPTSTLRYTGSSDVTTDRSFTMSSGVGGGATIESSGIGSLSFNNTVALAYGTTNETRILTLGGTNTGANTFGKVIANNGSGVTSVTKSGVGTWVLNQTNTYTGATTVSTGTLVVNGSISTSSLTTVATGAILGGSGTIGALTVSSGGFINPGNSPGILSVSGAYTQAGLYTAEINGLTAGTEHDQINVTGSVDITGGSLAASFSAGTYAANDLIFILLNDGSDAITGTYSGLAQGATVTSYGGFNWNISYVANSGGSPSFTGGNDIALMAEAIPEPKTALLGVLGVLLLLRRRRN